eukprot:COSAG06_NODE_39780_length_408_cov_12.343042_1_plen_66_part_10
MLLLAALAAPAAAETGPLPVTVMRVLGLKGTFLDTVAPTQVKLSRVRGRGAELGGRRGSRKNDARG